MVEYSEEDPKPQVEESCKVECLTQLRAYKACAERIKQPGADHHGHGEAAHCTGQYFDFWHCVDKCAAPKLFALLK
jgi:ubiquinol-cytochrome c reductase subunit 6